MAAFTLDELVIRLQCTDGTLFVDRQWLLHVSQTFTDLQEFSKGELINDVEVKFERRAIELLLRFTNPSFVPLPAEEYSNHQDQILLALDWLGPIGDTETIVKESMGVTEAPEAPEAPDAFVCVLSSCNRVIPEYIETVAEDQLVEFVTKFNGGVTPTLIKDEDQPEDEETNEYTYEMDKDSCKHEFIMDPCKCKKTMHCVRKGDQTVPEIIKEICYLIC